MIHPRTTDPVSWLLSQGGELDCTRLFSPMPHPAGLVFFRVYWTHRPDITCYGRGTTKRAALRDAAAAIARELGWPQPSAGTAPTATTNGRSQ